MAIRIVKREPQRLQKREAKRELWSRAVDVLAGFVATRGSGGDGGSEPQQGDARTDAAGCNTCAKEAAAIAVRAAKVAKPAAPVPPSGAF